MRNSKISKTIICIIIGIILYVIIDLIIGEVVNANPGGMREGNEEMFPFYWLILIVGGSIMSTLTYVSWRKYKGEKRAKQDQQNDK
ncbi:sporulation protein YpjB [Ornithinibacillus bavariensis]|uniref:Uncharacterized protein n=1 Tax=Ornithinibacillus bavariensis TaxID=545502 RepID=A0A919X9F1_9BACI|nr:sporulation protein YpjB [Ornithinibacillus bavariensis]GIO28442.1 hypothetical protein J43TS3_30530 [Ornithinibacillus bavariensis]